MVEEGNGHYAEVNGLNMYYEDYGSGPPLVLIHGGIANSGMNWAPSIPIFSKHFRVIALDSRGHGKTDNPSGEFSYRLMADDTVALIKRLGLEKPIIYGWSDGGQIVLEIGVNYPGLAKALIPGAALADMSDYYVNFMKVLGINGPGDVDVKTFKDVYAEFAEAAIGLHSAVYGDHYFEEVLFVNISRMWTDPKAFLGERISKIQDPTLVIQGDRDEAIPLEDPVRIHRLIPNSELAIVPGADHGACISQPDRIVRIILDYLERLQNKPSADEPS
ncbi:MAG: alpha/beta fold hydrolase [Candidatus Sifarchaeia archaeon]